jgi:regulator of replication initiation timing
MIIENYEEKLKVLSTENNELRNSLKDLQEELKELFNSHESKSRKRSPAVKKPKKKKKRGKQLLISFFVFL